MKELEINGVVVQAYTLTAAQRMHYYTVHFCPKSEVLNICTGLYIHQETYFELLKKAVYEAYKNFGSMRLRFVKDEDGQVYQYMVPFEDRDIELVDFSNWREEAAHNEMIKWSRIPFERYNSPMNKVVMIKLPGGYNGLYIKADHMTMDSSSVISFYRYILETYCHIKYDTDMPKPMKSYIAQLEKDLAYEAESEARKKDEEFWMGKMTESEPIFTDFSRKDRLTEQRIKTGNPELRSATITSDSVEADIAVYKLEKDPSERFIDFCQKNNVPVVCLLLMGLRTVFSKFAGGEKDISVKSCVARRGTLLEKHSGGTRIHFFPLRTIIEPETTFIDALRIIQAEQNKLFRHADYDPIEYTRRRSAHWKLTPGASYECLSLTYQPMAIKSYNKSIPDVPYKSMWYTNGVAAQPLYLTVMHRVEDNGLNFNFEYQKNAVTKDEMEYLYYYLCRAIFRGIEDPERTVGEILDMI